jgi:hypothetical protein
MLSPARVASRPGRHGEPGVARRERARDRQPAAGGVAGQGDGLGRVPLFEELAVGGDHVLDVRRERVLWRQPVVQGDAGNPGSDHQACGEAERCPGGAGYMRPAVEVEQGSGAGCGIGADAQGGPSAERGLLHPDAFRHWQRVHQLREVVAGLPDGLL